MAKNSALTTITNRAKAMRRANKNLDWRSAVQKASAEYNKGKKVAGVGKTKKKPAAKKAAAAKPAKKKITVKRSTSTIKISGIAGTATSQLRDVLGKISNTENIINRLLLVKKSKKGTERTAVDRDIKNHRSFLAGLKKQKVIIKRFI